MSITFSTATLQVQLRNPELGDTRESMLNVQNKLDMNGKLHTWLDPLTSVVMALKFVALSFNKALEARNFIVQTAETDVTYIDQDAVAWKGRILTKDFEIDPTGICNNSVTIQFEGNKV